ncbi:MAG: response regulator transcription factor [Oscillospiraceae bacterium]|jgi:two-component system response regulator RegX3
MNKILLIEDEDSIRDMVALNLKMDGYDVDAVMNAEKALEMYTAAEDDYALLIIDIMLPGMNGLELCGRVRKANDKVGIIMLTAKSQFNDKMLGFASGADDYITKPFSVSELLARVKAVYRRCTHENGGQDLSEQGIFKLDSGARIVRKGKETLELTQIEYQIMKYFFEHADVALSREDILRAIWGESYVGDVKIVDVNIRRLRMKVEDDPSNPRYILTVWGFGYRWNPNGKEPVEH